MKKRSHIVSGIFAVLLLSLSAISLSQQSKHQIPQVHPAFDDLDALRDEAGGGLTDLPIGWTGQFYSSGFCDICHGLDTLGVANVDHSGKDINVVDDWRAGMMANAARDPFWQAKVTHEVAVNPALQTEIESTCVTCHAPMGRYASLMSGDPHYSFADMLADPVAMDGVSCSSCHMISDQRLGSQHSGNIEYDTLKKIFGPYDNSYTPPMVSAIGQAPVYGEHINDAGLCASCHTLLTASLDLSGVPTGNTFVEQATYHEWLNSDFETEDITCQQCHMPRLEDSVILSGTYPFLDRQSPWGLHEFAGANTFMTTLMRDNAGELGLTAEPEHFDSSLAAIDRMMTRNTLEMELDWLGHEQDTAFFELLLRNLSGHKFPTGYPSRRAWVEFVLTGDTGDTLFASGLTDEEYRLPEEDDNYEPHHQIITDPSQVQIYELVPVDVNGDFASVLEFEDSAAKDNRLTPRGFSKTHNVYDTTHIAGLAFNDPDFNMDDGTEGSGTDRIRFNIPLNTYLGGMTATVKVWYQTLPPKWTDDLFSYSEPLIDQFKDMYFATEPTPFLVKSLMKDSIEIGVGLTQLTSGQVEVFPTLSQDGLVYVKPANGLHIQHLELVDLNGRLLHRHKVPGSGASVQLTYTLPDEQGIYLLTIYTNRGVFTTKVLRR